MTYPLPYFIDISTSSDALEVIEMKLESPAPIKPFLINVICLISCLILFSGIVSADDKPKVYSLEESIDEAFRNNWSVKAKKEAINGSMYVKKQAKASFFPSLNTTYGYTRLGEVTKRDPVPIAPGVGIPGSDLNTQDNYQWSVGLSQPLFTGFALVSSYELGKLGIDAAKIDLELEKLDLALNVKDTYFNILKADRAVEVAEKAVEALESQYKVVKSFYEVGMSPINDLLKVEVELGNVKYSQTRALIAAKLTRSAFNTVLARPVNKSVEVEDLTAYIPETGDFDSFLERAIKNRPEVKALDTNIMQVEQQIRLAKSGYYPKANLNLNYVKEGDDPGVDGSQFHDDSSWNVTASLSWTFWEWGKTKSAVREKESLQDQLLKTRQALIEGISLEIRQAILDLEQEEKNIPVTRKAVEQGEENLRVSQERYKAQVTTSTEVLDAQTLLTQARVNYYSALYDRNLAKARLMRALGDY